MIINLRHCFRCCVFCAWASSSMAFNTGTFSTEASSPETSSTETARTKASSAIASNLMAKEYGLAQAVAEAQQNDPWLQGSRYQQESLDAKRATAGTLPDPLVRLGIANVPVDSLDFAQEGMTQFTVGVSQRFPRGNTRSLQQEKLAQLSLAQPFARANRQAMVAVTVAHLWLDAYRNEQSIRLIEQDRSLFEYLVDVAESSYANASGKTRQQDLVRAQLELTRLEDRLARLHLMRDTQIARLNEWLLSVIDIRSFQQGSAALSLLDPSLFSNTVPHLATVTDYLTRHPKIRMIEQRISAGETEVKLAKQGYKPQWGLNAGYGYRDKNPLGNDRSDLFSVGVSFDVPLFTTNRQDKQVIAASAEREYNKTERALALRQLKAGFDAAYVRYQRLLERQALYRDRLLQEMSEQSEASLTAYTNDDGDFAEVVRSRIAELNAHIDALTIDIDIQKTIAQLNYFLPNRQHTQTNQPAHAVGVGESR